MNDSAAALSDTEPTRPIDCTIPNDRQAAAVAAAVYSAVGVEDHPVHLAAAGGGGQVQRRHHQGPTYDELAALG